MGSIQSVFRKAVTLLVTVASFSAMSSRCPAQESSGNAQQELPWTQEMKQYPGLPEELQKLFLKLQQNVHFPDPRTESRLLSLSPNTTVFYMAIPNYGQTASQVLAVFRQERKDSEVLRNWWTHGSLATDGPKIEDALEKFSQLHQFLGDEITVSVTAEGKEPKFLVVSQIQKPGLKPYLQQLVKERASSSKSSIRILDSQELAALKEKPSSDELFVLLQNDFVAASEDVPALRSFAKRLASGGGEFASSPFGQRIGKEYQGGGVTVMAAADLQPILQKASPVDQRGKAFQQSGFADLQYAVWGHRQVEGKSVGEVELSFSAPRHGAAAWLARPRPLGSLDFVSPKPVLAASLVLIDPAQIFEDAKSFSDPAKSNFYAAIPGVEQVLKISIKDDLLAQLSGEITVEMDSTTTAQPLWKVILGVKDSRHLQATLDAVVDATHLQRDEEVSGGITYYSMMVPSGKEPTPVSYAFADGYLVLAPTRDIVAEAIRLHRSGESLAKSPKFLAALPPGRGQSASAMFFQDPLGIASTQLKTRMPDLAESLKNYSNVANPAVISLYGEESAIREVSSNQSFDAAGVLVVAAIAIPNLLKSKIAANEASAVGSVRTINTAQITYAASFPKNGYAPDLASLGLDPDDPNKYSKEHSGMLDEHLGNASCTASSWCTKSGYQFRVKSLCKLEKCTEYVVVAKPVSDSTGTRSFCSTSDGIIRYKLGAPLAEPLTTQQCKTWLPLR